MKKIIFSIVLMAISTIALQAQNKLNIDVSGIENPTGKLYIAVFGSENVFLSDDAADGKIVEVTGDTMNIVFDNLKDGSYAVAIFQDENSNGRLDLGKYGIPLEKYGFSNNVDPALLRRAPLFDECSFEISGNASIGIDLVKAVKK